jgi:hypothetical protein
MEDPMALVDTDAALHPFVEALQDSQANSLATVRALVGKILSHPDIFCGYDQVKALLLSRTNIDDAALLTTLDLFSYGSYGMYSSNQGSYLPLNEKQIVKMRQLTLLSCVQAACEQGASTLSYTTIGEALQLPDQRDMEQIIISCIFGRALNGKLCQKSCQFLILDVPVCVSRDVPLDTIPLLLQRFQSLQDRLSSSFAGVDAAHAEVSLALAKSEAYWKAVQEKEGKALHSIKKGPLAVPGNVRTGDVWPDGGVARRPSASRQSNKRSRGGLGGSFTDPFQRY